MSRRKVPDHVAKARLLQLADLLETKAVKKHFNFSEWGAAAKGKDNLLEEPNLCGTTACALGWAPALSCAKKAGIKLVLTSGRAGIFGGPKGDEYMGLSDERFRADFQGRNGDYMDPEEVALELFGIGYDAFSILFMPGGSPFKGAPGRNASAKAVAANIRKFVDVRYG